MYTTYNTFSIENLIYKKVSTDMRDLTIECSPHLIIVLANTILFESTLVLNLEVLLIIYRFKLQVQLMFV